MAKIVTTDRFVGGEGVAENSLSVVYGDLLTFKSGFLDKAVDGDRIEGISVEEKTFDADNQTVKKAKLQYVRVKDETQFEVATSADITQANVGQTFDLNAGGTLVDVASAGTGDQMRLREVKGARKGIFVRNK